MAVKKESMDFYRTTPPDRPITTQTVIGDPSSVEDGIEMIADHVRVKGVRDGKFEFVSGGVVVRVTLADKALPLSYESY